MSIAHNTEIITIPAGVFLMGESLQRVELPEFRIAKYPVTNMEYYCFIKATGYRLPDHWRTDGSYPAGLAHHPVVFVSWLDVIAYTEWLDARLPSEAEWEKAARGTEGRVYPWGNEFKAENCNTSEAGTDGTRPIDAHPGGVSPYGVMDMAGNVWEWTTTNYENEAHWRVLKGGAWDYKGLKDTRCAFRVYFRPTFRNSAIGFRCCWD